MKNSVVTIKTIQIDFKGNKDCMELMSECKIYKKNGNTYIVYEESELSGMEGTTTTIKINNNRVVMKRFGINNSELVFEMGKKFKTNYKTSCGCLPMEMVTKQIDFHSNEECEKIKLNLVYDIKIVSLFEGRNIIEIYTK